MPRKPRHTEAELREAVDGARSISGALQALGLRPAGGNHRSFKRWIEFYGISIAHFDPNWANRYERRATATPLGDVLVEGSTYARGALKRRLYDAGLKPRRCEMCGQGELWRNEPMSLILDHVNGVPTDNRLTNLRILCPNCNATLDTHCGRRTRIDRQPRACLFCGELFTPKYGSQKYCSQLCGTHSPGPRRPNLGARKVARPALEQLREDMRTMTMLAVGRKYGVSDNAVRKWIRWYEEAAAREASARGVTESGSGDCPAAN